MAAPKRDSFQIEKDRAEIAYLYLQGKTQRDIAEYLKKDPDRKYELTQQTISNDIKVIKTRWQTSSLMNFNQAKAQELAKIDNLELVYWRAWENSCKPTKKTKTRKIDSIKGPHQEGQIETKEQFGDKKWLDGVQWCIEKRLAIFGIEAPKRLKVGDDNLLDRIKWDTLTPGQLQRIQNGEDPRKIIPGLSVN